MGKVLDYLLGPRDWCVIRTQGKFLALQRERLAMPQYGPLSFAWKNLIVKDLIREKHAVRLARKLEQQK
jgi:hypothetical protein